MREGRQLQLSTFYVEGVNIGVSIVTTAVCLAILHDSSLALLSRGCDTGSMYRLVTSFKRDSTTPRSDHPPPAVSLWQNESHVKDVENTDGNHHHDTVEHVLQCLCRHQQRATRRTCTELTVFDQFSLPALRQLGGTVDTYLISETSSAWFPAA